MKSTEEMLQAAVQQLQTAEQARLTSETDPARRQLLHLQLSHPQEVLAGKSAALSGSLRKIQFDLA